MMSTELMLENTSVSLLIIEERRRCEIVIGVPHHAPAGITKLPCADHPDSDENVGFLGRYIAEKLDSCSIIAYNCRVDVNKFRGSDYAMQIASWNPKFLVEIHGHGGTKANFDIEISSGSAVNEKHSMQLADKLKVRVSKHLDLKPLRISGEYNGIYFKASDSVTIRDGRWVAFHIELPPKIRRPAEHTSGKPCNLGYQFCDCLVDALTEIMTK